MKRLLAASIFALVATVFAADTASAQNPASYGFLPFGFYQPYGARYGTSIRTPPYFATNPPVYYGSRHARPYGLSPFASPPLVAPSGNYKSRLRSQFLQPTVPTPQPLCNPCISHGKSSKELNARVAKVVPQKGLVRTNPFVDSADRLAKK